MVAPSPDFYCPVCDGFDSEPHTDRCCPHPTVVGGQLYSCTPLRQLNAVSVFQRDLDERRNHAPWRSPYPFYKVWIKNPSGPWCAAPPRGKCGMRWPIRRSRCRRTTPKELPRCYGGSP